MAGALGLLAVAPIQAQETRAPARARVWIDGDEVRPFDLLVQRRARIGVTLDMRAIENDSIGATIQAVTPGGPAAKAGLRSGDIVVRFNGRSLIQSDREDRIRDRDRDRERDGDRERSRGERDGWNIRGERRFDPDDDQSLAAVRLIELVAKLEPGDTVAVEYRRGRDGESRTTQIVTAKDFGMTGDRNFAIFPDDGDRMLRRIPMLSGDGARAFSLGFGGPFADLELAPMNPSLGSYFGTSEGVLVVDAPEKNPLGLRGGDVILSVDGRTARGPASLLRILRSYEDGDVVKLEIMRNRSRQTITSKMSRDED
jgi:S1-C subfamily serine protease